MNKNVGAYYIRLLIKKGRILFAPTALLLSGCANNISQFSIPDKVEFQGQRYVKITNNQLDDMQHLLYLPENSTKNTEDWDKGILFFLDKNSKGQTLEQRLAFRQSNFAKQPNVATEFSIWQNELQSRIIYPPTERFQNIMFEVTRGRNSVCGYGQMQFSDKLAVSKIAKKSKNLTAYTDEMAKLALAFNQMLWKIECR